MTLEKCLKDAQKAYDNLRLLANAVMPAEDAGLPRRLKI